MPTPETDTRAPEQLELGDASLAKAAKIAQARERLLNAISCCRLSTLEERVAWILNNYPKTRDSDIGLQVRFWREFESGRFDGDSIGIKDYYRLTKLTSLTRARQKIQNDLKLFQASEEVEGRRKKLENEQRQLAKRPRGNIPNYSVYFDESGKTQDKLIVGSVWFLHGSETLRLYRIISHWKASNRIDGELHFKSITQAKLPNYCALADLIADNASAMSFRVISVEQKGIGDQHKALLDLAFLLLTRSIEREAITGRAPLPRSIQACMDSEQPGRDKLFMAELAEKMKQAAASLFSGNLYVEEFTSADSAENVHLQVADLFTSSVSRKLNTDGERNHPKDQFAEYFLRRIGIRFDQGKSESVGDMTAHIIL